MIATVERRFTDEATYWDQVYRQHDVFSRIHQRRQRVAVEWSARLCLPRGSRALEVGCGTGGTALALSELGFRVVATDAVWAMIDLARRRARVYTALTNAMALGFRSARFELVLALGVLPWLQDPAVAVREMARVLTPGGYVIANMDNRARFDVWLDPLRNPLLVRPVTEARLHPISEVDGMLCSAGLEPVMRTMVGFGPLTFLGHNVLPDSLGVPVEAWLQRLADNTIPGIRSLGAQYMFAARKVRDGFN
jgi:ubiquinone/menaquinone biosynthesis C-methylase UbiE